MNKQSIHHFPCISEPHPPPPRYHAKFKESKFNVKYIIFNNERKSEQAHIPHASTLRDNAAHKEWQCHALVIGNRKENHNRILVIIGHT